MATYTIPEEFTRVFENYLEENKHLEMEYIDPNKHLLQIDLAVYDEV
jgi:hypothetical protein